MRVFQRCLNSFVFLSHATRFPSRAINPPFEACDALFRKPWMAPPLSPRVPQRTPCPAPHPSPAGRPPGGSAPSSGRCLQDRAGPPGLLGRRRGAPQIVLKLTQTQNLRKKKHVLWAFKTEILSLPNAKDVLGSHQQRTSVCPAPRLPPRIRATPEGRGLADYCFLWASISIVHRGKIVLPEPLPGVTLLQVPSLSLFLKFYLFLLKYS